jgi:hypothetical protein
MLSDSVIAKLKKIKFVEDQIDELFDFILDRLISKSFSISDVFGVWTKIKALIGSIKKNG